MALIAMSGGSNTPKTTTLWSNPDASQTFGAQDVTLSSDIDNFDYIKISYKSGNTVTSNMIEVSELKKMVGSSTDSGLMYFVSPSVYYNTYELVRSVKYVSNTVLHFFKCLYVNVAGNRDSYCVPTEIIGISL